MRDEELDDVIDHMIGDGAARAAAEVQALLAQEGEVPLGLRARVEARVFAAISDGAAGREWRGRLIVAAVAFATLSPRLGLLPTTLEAARATLLLGPVLIAGAVLAAAYARLIDGEEGG
ncbi:MAG TPA: hypothetical protein VFS40_13740 [Gemmatimonadales bacterium]|nr:hypothetical protein [Gemmatimonadales bacterium]